MANFKARIGRDVPKEGETRVVFSVRLSDGSRMEIDGVYPEIVAMSAFAQFYSKATGLACGDREGEA